MVEPNFGDSPLSKPAFLLVFLVRFSLIQKKFSELGRA